MRACMQTTHTHKHTLSLTHTAPGLKKMKIFQESGEVSVYATVSVASIPYMSEHGSRTGQWGRDTNPDGVLDITAWNEAQAGMMNFS